MPAETALVEGEVEEAVGGHLTSAGRKAALDTALPLLATYFAEAPTWGLEVSAQVAIERDPVLEDLAAGVRLRASLAAADRLILILTSVAARPSFRYTQVSAESVGTIRGRLDVARYSREQGRISVPRRYPVQLVERATATPENVLAAYATLWVRRDLRATPRGLLPPKSPEARDLRRLLAAMDALLGLPLLAGTLPLAEDVWRRSGLTELIDRVSRRLAAGRVAHAQPYFALVEWITATREGQPVAAVGDREWTFYDERFDTKLFEIWCLLKFAESINSKIGPPMGKAPNLAKRADGPIYEWNIGTGSIELHFQPNLQALTGTKPVWTYQPDGDPLRGFPDMAVRTRTFLGDRLALFDPKLRRRKYAPTEELYKVLGYFANVSSDHPPAGAIIYHSPNLPTSYHLATAAGGRVVAVGVDPERHDPNLFSIVADIALYCAGLGESALQLLALPVGEVTVGAAERVAAIRQAVAVEGLRRAAVLGPEDALEPTRKGLRSSLREVWARLGGEVQMMIVTAEYFANKAPDDADHSGPLLGLAAAFERLLLDEVFNRASVAGGRTLGSYIRLIDLAFRGQLDSDASALSENLRARPEVDGRALQDLLVDARKMNRDYRIPAAHATLVSAATWVEGRDLLLHPERGLIPRLARALGLREPP